MSYADEKEMECSKQKDTDYYNKYKRRLVSIKKFITKRNKVGAGKVLTLQVDPLVENLGYSDL